MLLSFKSKAIYRKICQLPQCEQRTFLSLMNRSMGN